MAGKRKTSTYWLHRPSRMAKEHIKQQERADEYKEFLARQKAERESRDAPEANKSNSEAPM